MLPQVIIHWRDADEEGTVLRYSDQSVAICVPGDDAPFVFDRVSDHWRERDHGRDVCLTFLEPQEPKSGSAPC